MPPLIEADAQRRVERYAQIAWRDGTLVEARAEPPADGWFARPMLALDVAAGSPALADEIFGPLLAVEPVAGVAEACDMSTRRRSR